MGWNELAHFVSGLMESKTENKSITSRIEVLLRDTALELLGMETAHCRGACVQLELAINRGPNPDAVTGKNVSADDTHINHIYFLTKTIAILL